MTTEDGLPRALKALADPTRWRIVQFLAQECCQRAQVDGEGNVVSPSAGQVCCHLTGGDRITSTVSHHLHELADAGIVKLERRGKLTVCHLEPTVLRELAQALQDLAQEEPRPCCP